MIHESPSYLAYYSGTLIGDKYQDEVNQVKGMIATAEKDNELKVEPFVWAI